MKNFIYQLIFLKEVRKIDNEINENKFFKVAIEQLDNNEYIVWAAWGRIGTAGQSPQCIYRCNNMQQAFAIAHQRIEGKI